MSVLFCASGSKTIAPQSVSHSLTIDYKDWMYFYQLPCQWHHSKLIMCFLFPPPGKAFEITYVRLKFYTSRPESFAIFKRTEENGPWLPYQYYSASCDKTYGKDVKAFIHPGDDERTSLCTDEFSDISPLSGGNVAFSTLEGRPSAYNFDQSLVLQVKVRFSFLPQLIIFHQTLHNITVLCHVRLHEHVRQL